MKADKECPKPPHAKHDRKMGVAFNRLRKSVGSTERRVKRIHKQR